MELVIQNCNSIDKASIIIEEGRLNIKFGVNGTGKSTIARAIELNGIDSAQLNDLLPFKYKENNSNNISPSINGIDAITSVSVFNEAYVE